MTAPKPAPDAPTPSPDETADPSPSKASELLAIADASAQAPPGGVALAPGALGVARVVHLDGLASGEVEVDIAGVRVGAALEGAVHPAVVETAHRRGELLLVTRRADGRVAIVGALRTQPTPGVDEMDVIRLEARRVEVRGTEEVQLRSGIATIALRAAGEVETYADRIVSRAEELQKIVARMLRLN